MSKSLNHDMGAAHEKAIAEKLGMRQSRGSGNQWRDPIDARHNHLDTEWAFAVDGKSTLAKSISVTLPMWEKAAEQAGAERPMLALRFYNDASLSRVGHDLAVCELDDFAAMRQAALAWEKARPIVERIVEKDPRCMPVLVALLKKILGEAA